MVMEDDKQRVRQERIRALNDEFRRRVGTGSTGQYLATVGVAQLPGPTVFRLWEQVRDYSDFTPDNDPYGEHDFGAFEAGDLGRLFWKIDYYDVNREYGSEDPSDPEKTTRVLTLMRDFEY
ncbi:MAG: DUF3768 domain-containing protein [Pseudomonadota bacterium]